MDKKTAYIMAYLGAFTLATALACGSTTGGGEPCDDDSQCSAGFVCDQGVNECIETCSSDIECSIGEKCLPRQGTSSGDQTCQIDNTNPNNTNNPNGCTTVDDCPNSDDYICNDQMMCEEIGTVLPSEFVVQIEDTTSGTDGCDVGDPGSDFAFARLLAANGDILGFASQIDVQIVKSSEKTNKYQDFSSIFNGEPPELDGTDQCPSGGIAEGNVVSVGCFGYILTQFVDDNDQPIALQSGMKIEVGEYGTQCSGSNDDSYEVSICSDTAAAKGGDPSSCTRDVGKARGFGSFSL